MYDIVEKVTILFFGEWLRDVIKIISNWRIHVPTFEFVFSVPYYDIIRTLSDTKTNIFLSKK